MNASLTSATSAGLAPRPTVLVPVGSLEQHGPHLPLDTDTAIAGAVASGVAATLNSDGHTPIMVAPAISYGASGEHQGFAGTGSIGSDVLYHVVVELTRSMRLWAERLILVNAHGGNVAALQRAVSDMIVEGHDVSWVGCSIDGADLHAGRAETSLMLHLRPGDVRLDLAEPGNTASLAELLPLMIAGGVMAVSPNGVLGDPTGASASEGAALLDSMVRDVATVTSRRLLPTT